MRTGVCCIGFVMWLVGVAAGATDQQSGNRYQGRAVQAVLRELQADGLRILFASTLVTPSQLVKAEPRARAPRDIAIEILAPHGLTLKEGPGRTWLVVRAAPAPRTDPAAPPQTGKPEAATPDAPIPLRTEERVEVTEKALEEPPAPSIYTLSSRKILETPGAFENVLQVLPALPGVVATDDENGRLAIRGGGPEHNVVLFDGVQIHSPQRFGDFTASFVNPATTAGMALDASGLDARHGGRLSSVTLLETRDGISDRAFAISGSAGLTSGDILAEGRLPGTKTGSWWATARGTYYKYVSDRFKDSMMPGFGDLQFKITAYPSARTKVTLLALTGEETMMRPSSQTEDETVGPDREFDAGNRVAAANVWFTATPRTRMHTTLSLYSNDARYVDNRIGLPGPFDRRLRVTDVAARHRVSVSWTPRHVLDTGVEIRTVRSSWAMRGATFGPDSRALAPDTWGMRIEYDDGPIDSRITRNQSAGWIQQRLPVGLGLEAEPGVRVDWNSFTGETAIQPRLRLTRRIGASTVWAGLSWQAQTPGHEAMQQGLQYYDLTGSHASELRNERSRQIVAGIEHQFGTAAALRVAAYRRGFDRLLVQRLESDAQRAARLSDYIIPADMPAGIALLEHRPTIRPDSVGTGSATGVEVLIQREQGRLTGWISYTLSKSERDLYGRTVPYDFDRRHALGVVGNFQIGPRLRLGVNSQHASGTPLTPLMPEPIFFRDPRPGAPAGLQAARGSGSTLLLLLDRNKLRVSGLNSGRMPMYARTDVRVTFALASWLDVYGEVINLMNRENFHPSAIFGGRPGQYEVAPTLPRLPSYGVRVRF